MNAKYDKRLEIIRLVKCEPAVKSCLERITQTLIYNPVEICENGYPIQKKLQNHFNQDLNSFIYSSIEMAHVCGFVAFYIKKRDGIPIFKVLPLGTFTWSTQLENDPSSIEVLKYEIQYFGGNIKQSDIHIFVYSPPCLMSSTPGQVNSPLDAVWESYVQRQIQLKTVLESEKWNMQKHLAITEKIDLKDPTTTGLSLLDDMRLYNLTGQHSGMDAHRILNYRSQQHTQTNNATESTFQWIDKIFKNPEGEKQAQTHILPPNSDIHELTPIEYSNLYEYMNSQFENAVFTYFNMTSLNKNMNSTSGASMQIDRYQHNSVQATGKFIEKLIQTAYCTAFAVPLDKVECKIKPMPRLQLENIADIKTLAEAGIMNPQDRMRTRAMFMER